MNFTKNSLAKKLIIILVTLLVFNVFYPSMSYAIDFGGILLEPVYWLLCSIYIPADLTMGAFITLDHFLFSDISLWTVVLTGGWNAIANVVVGIGQAFGANWSDWGVTLGNYKLNNSLWGAITGEYGDKTISDLFVGPDTIFKGDIPGLDANIFNYVNSGSSSNPWEKAAVAVAKFYVIIRNIAAIVMLAGLLYTGIQILLSSNIPTKKTQYLMLLQDWLIGMGILIFSHVIMVIIFELAESITGALNKSLGIGGIKWYLVSNMMYSNDSTTQTIALLLYHWVQILTIIFAISYFKRFFWTCVLVVFAPVFPVMYAFGQQSKQIYTNWLKEFILNAMVQPFHLVVYSVLIIMPLNMANAGGWNWSWENPSEVLYALMAMSMIRPAEKYLRRLFGMDKGIANMASYDSGMKTVTDIGKAAMAVAKTAAAVYTGGASAMAGGALSSLGSGAVSKLGQGLSNVVDKLGSGEGTPPVGEGEEKPAVGEGEEKPAVGEGDAKPPEGDGGGTPSVGEGIGEVAGALGTGLVETGAALNEGEANSDASNNKLDLPPDPTVGAGTDTDDFSSEDVSQLGKTITDGIETSNERKRIYVGFCYYNNW